MHKVIADYLLADTGLGTLVSDRIYPGSDLPEGYKPSDGPAVLFAARGGGPAYHSATLQPSVQYRSYALSEEQAAEVDRALFDALNDQAGSGIRQSRLETVGQPLLDPETGWIFILSGYRHWLVNQ